PERKGAAEFTKAVASNNVAVYLGHSDATFEQAKACVEAGATGFTHTYNGMGGLNHRVPGMVGAALSMHLVDDELICDGHHVNPYAARIVIEKKGAEHVALITDCMRAGLMPDGDYVLGELPVVVANGTARLKAIPHSLAGLILMLNEAIKNVVDWNIATDEEAIEMASYTAAKSSKVLDKCGIIADGRDADFIVLNNDMSLSETYLDGVSRYKA